MLYVVTVLTVVFFLSGKLCFCNIILIIQFFDYGYFFLLGPKITDNVMFRQDCPVECCGNTRSTAVTFC